MSDDKIQARLEELIRDEIRGMSAYHVPDSTGMVKLDAMENPYDWPLDMREEWATLLRKVALNRYPDPAAETLKARLRDAMEIPPTASLLLGNGSDELIQMICMAVAAPGRAVLSVDPGFAMYRIIATMTGMDFHGVPLAEDFSLDMDVFRREVTQRQPAVIFIAYPNNPTGNLLAEQDIREIIETAPGLVVVDEAYHVFAGHTFMDVLMDHPNLLVMRTVSKMGLAGLRLGVLAGAPAWIDELDKIRLPYNINVLTQVSAQFALACEDVLMEQATRIRTDREQLFDALQELPGITPYPSQANFILFRTAQGRAASIFEGLKSHSVLIKNLHGSHPALQDCLRVTVGSDAENAAFLSALIQVL